MKYRIGACVAIVAGATPVFAEDGASEDNGGFYIGIDLGSASLNDTDVVYYDVGGAFGGTGNRDEASASIDTKSAFAIGGAIGYDFGTIRTDLEIDYSKNDLEALTFESINGAAVTLSATDRQDICDYFEADTCAGSGNTFTFDGSGVRQVSVLANVWVDLPIGKTIVPYAGGGIGVGGFETDGEGSAAFAWQLGAGIAARISSGFSLSADYRYRQIGGATIEYDDFSGFEVDDLGTNIFSIGARITF